ncbi:MAG TPA: hypothetical protein VFV29_09740, partial [Actinomycetota bacterium]|nr:hypothetical protein [Actinomycetota bacterium]
MALRGTVPKGAVRIAESRAARARTSDDSSLVSSSAASAAGGCLMEGAGAEARGFGDRKVVRGTVD